MDISKLATVLAEIDGDICRGFDRLSYDELAREIMQRAGRTYWVLTYHGETGPDSWQGGYDTPAQAREALGSERDKTPLNGFLDPARLVATRKTVIMTETDEDW